MIEEVTLTGGLLKNALWSLLSAKTIRMQIFRPVQLVVLAAEGKNLDRGSSSTGRAVKILSGHPPVLKTIHV